jgi:serine/threonine protein kinase
MAAFVNDPSVPPRRVVFLHLDKATNSFSAEAKIGEGSTGEVFRGVLDEVHVAVKRLKLPEGATNMARQELQRRFRAEFVTLSAYKHARLVRLLGWGEDGDPNSQHPFCLVFELLEGGSLENRLLSPSGEQSATWLGPLSGVARIDIVLGVGAGLGFLHGLREPGSAVGCQLIN